MSRLARLLLVAVLAAGALVAAGCGSREDIRTIGDTEGIYVDVGPLAYQVQISRYLNPADVEDREYLTGLSPTAARLSADQVWFAVFMRVQNYTDQPQTPATDISITDTQENVYRPVALPSENDFAYRARPLGPNAVLPNPESIDAQGPIGGSLLLYKINVASVQNRPLELHIRRGANTEAVIDLDV